MSATPLAPAHPAPSPDPSPGPRLDPSPATPLAPARPAPGPHPSPGPRPDPSPTAARKAPRGWDTLRPATRRILLLLVRFGFLTDPQAARLDGRPPRVRLCTETSALRKLGLLRTLRPTSWRGQHKIYTLTPRSYAFLQALPAAPPRVRADLDRLDEMLAAADLALELQARGAGRWHTWPEHLRAHPPDARPAQKRRSLSVHPAGVLEEPGGVLRPVWVLLHPRAPGVLHHDLKAVAPRRPLTFGTVYALPELCEALKHASLPASIEPWTPPHLNGRRPLLPGWWQVGTDGESPRRRATASAARVSDRPSLGPIPLAVLAHLDRFGHATASQVARARPCSLRRAQGVLTRLRRQGLAQSHSQGHNQPLAWSATRAGLAVIGSRRLPVPPEPLHRRHTLALGDLTDELTRQTGGTWETEREVRAELLRTDPRHPPAPPDGRLTLPDGRRACIQLQISLGKATRQLNDAWALRAGHYCHEVWFLCTPEVAPVYRGKVRPSEAGFIKVTEWIPPDHSAGFRETTPRTRKTMGHGRLT